ncbi:MAG: NAD(P)/FAD-dependent oxidoreductase, partial [Oscillospiraceae bacterium]
GISGPLVLTLSSLLPEDLSRVRLAIDLKPALDEQKLDARVLRDIGENPNREMGTIAAGLVPHSMAPVVLRRAGLTGSEKANSLTKEQRRALVQVLKHFTLELTGPRPVSEAIVTAGGVKVGEVTPNTMASKRVRGLFFAGEVLDVDAYTGGFNLQIAWATGYLAGLSAAESEEMT